MDPHTKTEIVNIIIEDVDTELLDEEIMHLVLDKRVSQPDSTITGKRNTFGQRAENDYKVNLKSEIIMQDLHVKMDQILENQQKILSMPDNSTGK